MYAPTEQIKFLDEMLDASEMLTCVRGVTTGNNEIHAGEAVRDDCCRAQKILLPFEGLDLSEHPDKPSLRRNASAPSEHLTAGRVRRSVEAFHVNAVGHDPDLMRGKESLCVDSAGDYFRYGDHARHA